MPKPYSKYTKELVTRATNQRTFHMKHYLTDIDRSDVVKECGDSATLLYQYYLSKAGFDDFEYTDTNSAWALGWNERKVKRYRQLLTKAGYYKQVTATYLDKRKVTTTYLGKDKVQELLMKESYAGKSIPKLHKTTITLINEGESKQTITIDTIVKNVNSHTQTGE